MQDKAKRAGADTCDSPHVARDLQDQSVVLSHVLELHPAHLTIPELVREITAGSESFREGDNVECAIRDLTGAGLLRCPGGVVALTRAALHFDRLPQP